MRLTNTVAWITGGGRRLGRALALALARRGCHLAIQYHGAQAEAHEVAKAAERMGRRALVYRADLNNVEDIRSMGRRIECEFDRLDILINCAAVFERAPLEEISEAAWDRALDVNLKGSAFCALEAARLMRLKRGSGATLADPPDLFAPGDDLASAFAGALDAPVSLEPPAARVISLDPPEETASGGNPLAEASDAPEPAASPAPALWGKIINFADWSAQHPYRNYLPYMVSKGGVVTLTQALAQELAPQITVNAIAPGTVLPAEGASPEELAQIAANVPLQRLGGPADVTAAALLLLEGSDYINGQILNVDGGRSVAQPKRM